MALKYLMDENVTPIYATQLRRKRPGTPPKSTLDPDILIWCEDNGFILVTNNRKSMPVHLADNMAESRHIPGIFVLNSDLSIGKILRN